MFRTSILDDEKVFVPFTKERIPFFEAYNPPTRPLFTESEKVHLVSLHLIIIANFVAVASFA